MIKMVSGAPLSVDLNASFILHENYQAGLLTRNFNTYGLFMQALFKDTFRIGYVFEVPTGSSAAANISTHEICISYRISTLIYHSKSSVFSF
jgi:hypothetical protein